LALVHGQVTPVWPPTGIALVAFLLIGRRAWPAVALGAFAVNLPIGPSPIGAAVIAAGNTLAPFVAAELLRRADFHRELDRLRDAFAIILGALGGMTISATVGSSVLVLWGSVPTTNFWSTWAVWWTGDAMGVLLVAPLLLSLMAKAPTLTLPGERGREIQWRAGLELVGLLAATGLVTYLLFQSRLGLQYLSLPVIMVTAYSFRLRGAAMAALIASGVAIWSAIAGTGPFFNETLLEKMITLQVFNVSVVPVRLFRADAGAPAGGVTALRVGATRQRGEDSLSAHGGPRIANPDYGHHGLPVAAFRGHPRRRARCVEKAVRDPDGQDAGAE
jgi:integral membrane sensor domain MASE1